MSLIKMYLHGQLLPIRFRCYVCAYVKYELYGLSMQSNMFD